MNDNRERMLDICFEIEGLLSLMLKRENDVPGKVEELLKQKVASLGHLCGVTSFGSDAETDSQAVAQSAEEEERDDAGVSDTENDTSVSSDDNATEAKEQESCLEESVASESNDEQNNQPNAPNPAPIVLTLNDKFRFRRELFGNNAAELSDALDVVNAVSNQAELDDYFYNDLCWDPENPDVKDFMAIASARFNK